MVGNEEVFRGGALYGDGAMAIISDASGLCVNRPNATVAKPSKLNLFHSGYKDGVAGDRASAWVVKEVQFTGSLTLNDGKPELTRVEARGLLGPASHM